MGKTQLLTGHLECLVLTKGNYVLKVIFFSCRSFIIAKYSQTTSVTKVQGLGLGQMATSSPSMVTAADIQYALDNNSSLIVNATQNSTYYTWERIYQPVGLANGEPFPGGLRY